MRTWSLHVLNHGLVDEHRQRKPSYYVWKDLNTPAVVEAQWDYAQEGAPASFTVTLTPNCLEDLPSYPLRDYRWAWELSDQAGKLLASGEQQLADLSSAHPLWELWCAARRKNKEIEAAFDPAAARGHDGCREFFGLGYRRGDPNDRRSREELGAWDALSSAGMTGILPAGFCG
jgi:hypothetical protein